MGVREGRLARRGRAWEVCGCVGAIVGLSGSRARFGGGPHSGGPSLCDSNLVCTELDGPSHDFADQRFAHTLPLSQLVCDPCHWTQKQWSCYGIGEPMI
eukprot:365339-Chlamydomonas_euryale.AAC.8